MKPRRIHITAVGSPTRGELQRLTAGLELSPTKQRGKAEKSFDTEIRQLAALASEAVGPNYRITINADLLTAEEDDRNAGRNDDEARAAEIQSLLADDDVTALVTLRGGAWFVRLLDRIDFSVLEKRKRPLHIFGFSEMTPLVNIAGQYRQAIGLYDLGPGFLYAGVKRHVQMNIERYARGIELSADQHEAFAAGWALARFRAGMADFFRDVVSIVEGLGCSRVPKGRLLAGRLPARSTIRIVGGNLSLTLPMMGTPYAPAFDTTGKWLALEEVNESPEQCDRMIAGLKHNGLLERAEGIILGDFHSSKDGAFVPAVVRMLKYHLPASRKTPIVQIDNFGHIWPIAPLPMHRDVILRHTPASGEVRIEIPWDEWTEKGLRPET
ncbi:MAG TPA: LD-carboxypeptidase [Phycisphaerae bacterium]|nr:LD-carboxypeptidase [Phycisphaerae bacterium]HQA00144.1 LD-carboxypeptidase [Phycisphaerae bacterium]